MIDIAIIWAAIIAFGVLAYVALDGFDLGIGVLFPFMRKEADRDTMVNAVAPVWDGNETWLVLGGGGLMAAFPLAFSILMPALYAPIIAMLLGLIFRGVAFEFRFRTRRGKIWWDVAFAVGSIVATFAQGVVLGAFVQGIAVEGRQYAGGWFDWLSAFSLFTGAALVAGYALLGAGWLVLKTEGELQERMFRAVTPLTAVVLLFILGVSLWTPLIDTAIAHRWFSWPNMLFLAPVPMLVAACGVGLFTAAQNRNETWPLPLALGLFVLSYLGLGISLFPYVVPRSVTIWDAAAPPESLLFLLIGGLILLPIILIYTGYAYWVFRGKVREGEGYH